MRPPTASLQPVAKIASDVVGERAETDRREAATKLGPSSDDAAAGSRADATSTAENNPDHRPVIVVRGLVRDAASGVGIEAARAVHLRSGREAVSGDDGTFLLRLPIDEDGAVLVVTKSGYAKRHVQIEPSDCCDATAELVIDLQPSQLLGQITGVVQDAEQQPLAKCQVELLSAMRDSQLVAKTTTTDQQGRFQLLGVPSGTQRIAVRADHHDDYVVNGIELGPRGTHDVGTITLQRFWWGSIHGKIVDGDGKAIANVEVGARTEKDDHGATLTRSDAKGGFELPRVAPGSVSLFLARRGQWAGMGSFSLQPRETVVHDVRLPVGANYVGGKVLIDGEPAHGYNADCEVSADELDACGLDSFYRSTRVGKDGRFRLDGLVGKQVQLSFTRARPWVSEGYDEPVATNSLDHVFFFGAKIGSTRVTGYVRDALGTPIAGVNVHPRDLHEKSARGITGADGYYQLVVPTTVHSSMSLHATHPNFLAATHRLPSWDTKETKIDFVLHPAMSAAKLTIRARHKESPVARALVILRDEQHRFVARGTTDARGQESFALGSGTWRVHVRHPDMVTSDQIIELTSNEQRDLEVDLESQPRYSRILEVRTEPDQPMVNVTVTAWQNGAWVAAGQTNELGKATLTEIPSGDIVFSVQPAGHARHVLPQSVRWEHGEAILFRIRPGLQTIAGTVYSADGSPAEFCELSCQATAEDGRHVRVYANTDREGRFQIEHLTAGSYELQAFVGNSSVKQTASPGDTQIVLRPQ